MGEKGLKSGFGVVEECGKGLVSKGQNLQKERGDVEDLCAASVGYLKESIVLCVSQLRNRRLRDRAKVRWAHCLAQQIAALVNLIKTIGSRDEEDLALWLSEINEKVPKKYQGIMWSKHKKLFR